jgi:predicted RND superfamily exporter protein
MSGIRNRIEHWFELLASLVFDRPWLFIIISVAMVAGLAAQLPKLQLDTSNESFLHKNDPTLSIYDKFKDQFGWDEFIIIAIEPSEVFNLAFLKKLKVLHDELADNVSHLSDITSMVNARNTRGEEDSLIVEDLLDKFPQNEADLSDLKERVMSNPLYLNRLISPDGRMTSIVLETDISVTEGEETDVLAGFDEDKPDIQQAGKKPTMTKDDIAYQAVDTVKKIIEKYQADDFKIYLAGSPVVTKAIKLYMVRDTGKFLVLAVLTIGLCLFIMFRRISGVLLTLLVVILALISTLGLMALCGVSFTVPDMILPSFLLAVGVGAVVHILALVYHRFDTNGDKKEAVVYALGHSGLAILMTSLTTAAGLVSFATTELAPIAFLGIFAGSGVMMSLVYTIILVPALLSIIRLKSKNGGKSQARHAFFDRVLDWVTDFSTGHPKSITVVSLLFLAVALFSAVQLSFSHNVLTWLPPNMPARQATEKIDKTMGGTINMEVLVDTKHENGLYDPAILKRLDKVAREIEAIENTKIKVAKATSIADVIKEIHKALNENREDFYVVPDNPALIPQEFLLFENSGSDDLEKVTDSRFQVARFTIQIPWKDVLCYFPFIQEVEGRFQNTLGERADITVTGMMSLFTRTVSAAINSMAKGYIIAGVTITIMMILLIGSFKIGLISMIPNLTPVLMVMGLLFWLDMPLDMYTMLIGAIALGLAVDDTVHFMHNFRRYYADTKDVKESVRKTLHTAGRAMLVTTIILSVGFFLFMFASMQNIIRFGLLTGVTVLLALMADFFTVPAMMVLIHQSSKGKNQTG